MVGTCKIMIAISTTYEAMCHRWTSQLFINLCQQLYFCDCSCVWQVYLNHWEEQNYGSFSIELLILLCHVGSISIHVEARGEPWVLYVRGHLPGFEMGSLTGTGTTSIRLDWLASKPQIFLSLPPWCWIASEHHHAQSFIGHCVLNLGPCTCLARTLATATSP